MILLQVQAWHDRTGTAEVNGEKLAELDDG
jgi:hypothetical protein